MIGPLVSYLAQPEHSGTRDNLTLIMVGAWDEKTNKVWEAVLAWVVSEK